MLTDCIDIICQNLANICLFYIHSFLSLVLSPHIILLDIGNEKSKLKSFLYSSLYNTRSGKQILIFFVLLYYIYLYSGMLMVMKSLLLGFIRILQ